MDTANINSFKPQQEYTNQNNQTQPFPQYRGKPLFSLSKGDNAFVICALILSIFTSAFGIFGGFALGYLISITLMITMFFIYFAKVSKARFLPIISGLLSLANAAVFVCTTNGSVRFFSVIISLLLSLVCFDGLVNGSSRGNRQTLGVFYSALSTVGNLGIAVRSPFYKSNGERKRTGKALLGLLCSLPVVAIVLPLLISSDEAFRGMMDNIFSNTFSTILKLVFGLSLSLFVISYGFSLKTGRIAKIKQGTFSGIENVYIISFLSAISLCYLLYLFSQLAYFFSAFKGFLPNGEITYAEYARKGFFEMCVIAVINLILVFLALILSKKRNGKVCHSIKAIATFIAVFTLIIIATAISKMALYIDAYGMTILRLTTSAFMIFLGIVFISVILRIYILKINIVKTALISAGCIILVLGTVNVNSVCAKYNYESYMAGKLETIDVQALYDLGDEGIPYIVKLASCDDTVVASEAQEYLADACLYEYFENIHKIENFTAHEFKQNQKDNGFEHFSIPKAKAYNSIFEYMESNTEFSEICQEYFEDGNRISYWVSWFFNKLI